MTQGFPSARLADWLFLSAVYERHTPTRSGQSHMTHTPTSISVPVWRIDDSCLWFIDLTMTVTQWFTSTNRLRNCPNYWRHTSMCSGDSPAHIGHYQVITVTQSIAYVRRTGVNHFRSESHPTKGFEAVNPEVWRKSQTFNIDDIIYFGKVKSSRKCDVLKNRKWRHQNFNFVQSQSVWYRWIRLEKTFPDM